MVENRRVTKQLAIEIHKLLPIKNRIEWMKITLIAASSPDTSDAMISKSKHKTNFTKILPTYL